jgi:aminoglycoside phosphotransferase family enzyme/predicted kinase
MPNSEQLIAALLTPAPYPHAVSSMRVIETHISWILLTGDFAYKVKKPVDLGFLDFSTLAARRHACDEELRLNRRLAPDIYIDVVPIVGTPASPRIAGDGKPFEYAVRMRQFPDDAVLLEQLITGQLDATDVTRLAETLAEFHATLPPAAVETEWATPARVWTDIQDSLDQIAATANPDNLADAEQFCVAQFERWQDLIGERRAQGQVRECHGDLHLGNLVRLGQRLTAFDALEFDPVLRWTDVMNEVAFLAMDFQVRERDDLAFAFLNRYLMKTGDYGGLALVPLFLAYRGLVRAKVTALAPARDGEARARRVRALVGYAAKPLRSEPVMIITCGLAGSGKTHLSAQLAMTLPAIHLRSDVERKRMFGLDELSRTSAEPDAGIYTAEASAATYQRLGDLAALVVTSGFSVIVDAACLRTDQRAALVRVAHKLDRPAVLLDCVAPRALLEERINRRAAAGRDASEADLHILQVQTERLEPPQPAEADAVFTVDTASEISAASLAADIRRVTRNR